MPRTRSLKWSELKIGMMAVVAIFIAASLILTLSGQGGFWWQRYYVKARFSNAGGVNQGSIVRVSGVKVGSVTKLDFAGLLFKYLFKSVANHLMIVNNQNSLHCSHQLCMTSRSLVTPLNYRH